MLPNGGGIAYGEFHLDRAQPGLADGQPAVDRGRADARQRVGHALGRDARPRDVTPDAFLALAIARAAARDQRTEHQPRAVVRAGGLLAVTPRRPARARAGARLEPVLRTGLDAAPTSSLKSVWFSALRDVGADARHHRVADARLEGGGKGRRPHARRDRLHPAGAGSRRSRRAPTRRRILDQQYERIKNPDRKAQFAFVRPAHIRRRARAGGVVRVARRRRQPPPRAVGARGPALPAPSAARAPPRRSISSRACCSCARSSAPATSSSRSAGWTRRSAATSRRARRRHGARRSSTACRRIPRAAAPHHPVVGGRSVSRQPTPREPPSHDDAIRILVTGGTFDKEYDELTGTLFFRTRTSRRCCGWAAHGCDLAIETAMMIDSLDMDDARRGAIVGALPRAPPNARSS